MLPLLKSVPPVVLLYQSIVAPELAEADIVTADVPQAAEPVLPVTVGAAAIVRTCAVLTASI